MSNGITVGAMVDGLCQDGPATITKLEWHGPGTVTVHYRDPIGAGHSRLLFAADLQRLHARDAMTSTFDADWKEFELAFGALRLTHAGLFDDLLAVHSANIEPLPHQVTAVYDHLLTRRPLRFLLADDPGAGKTIMAGLYIKELLARRIARRCIVAAPGGLAEQWRDELLTRFGLTFTIFDRRLAQEAPDGNPFSAYSLLIVRVDQIARDGKLLAHLRKSRWDLAIVDEAHKLSAHYWGDDIYRSRRYEFGEVLSRVCENFLLMTATPHSGKEGDFQLFLSLLDRDRFVGPARHHELAPHTGDLYRRLIKEQLCHLDGRPLFPERRALTVEYELSSREQELYERVSDYVRFEMDKVEDDARGRSVGFALMVLQRRLASSPEAILRSLTRRLNRLEATAQEIRLGAADELGAGPDEAPPEDDDELTAAALEHLEDDVSSSVSAARSLGELEAEILSVNNLVALSRHVRDARVDRKWEELARLLQSPQMFNERAERRKLIVFTEHRDTLDYLVDRIVELLGSVTPVLTIHGGIQRADRLATQHTFRTDPDVWLLLATDAAGEGVNLQCAHLMVNYDLPWNPNRLEQRFGRIHRIGQTEVCHLWNLAARNTREGDVFATLLKKLEIQRAALGDKVFDVLGEVLTGSKLEGLLREAIRYGSRPEVRARLDSRIDSIIGHDMSDAIAERQRMVSPFDAEQLMAIRRRMARGRAWTLQPHVVSRFVRDALPRTGSELLDDGDHRVRIVRVGKPLRDWNESLDGTRVERRYDLATFHITAPEERDGPPVELLCPGHPLVDGLADIVRMEMAEILQRGVRLVDPCAQGPSLLALLRFGVALCNDDAGDASQEVVQAERVVCLRVQGNGSVSEVALQAFGALRPAPKRSAPSDAAETVAELRLRALQHLQSHLAPALKAQVRTELEQQYAMARDQRQRRLGAEIERLNEQLARLQSRGSDVEEALVEVSQARQRLVERLRSYDEEPSWASRLVQLEPALLTVAWIDGTGDAAAEAMIAAAKQTVRLALAPQGVVDEPLPLAGFNFMLLTPDGRRQCVIVRTDDGGGAPPDLTTAEQLVARNMGSECVIATVHATGVRWSDVDGKPVQGSA